MLEVVGNQITIKEFTTMMTFHFKNMYNQLVFSQYGGSFDSFFDYLKENFGKISLIANYHDIQGNTVVVHNDTILGYITTL